MNAQPPARRQPRPSIYVRLMPLMYGLIGAASALFLHALFCGRLGEPPKCKPASAAHAAAGPGRGPVVAAASESSAASSPPPGAGALKRAAAPKRTAAPKRSAAPKAKAPKAKAPKAKAKAKAPKAKAPKAKVAKAKVPKPASPSAPPTARSTEGPSKAKSAEGRLSAAIRPCVRRRARSFRLAVRLRSDGKVRRVFVARDPGVNATMSECIQRQLAGTSLPLKLSGGGYAEWRVRQTKQVLSLTLLRPARLQRR